MLTSRDRAEIKEMINDALGVNEECLFSPPLESKWAAIRMHGDKEERLAQVIEIKEDENGFFVSTYAGGKSYIHVDDKRHSGEVA